MKKARIVICKEVEREPLPILLPRHITSPIAVCRDVVEMDLEKLSREILEDINERGYALITSSNGNKEAIKGIANIEIEENEYIKIFVE
ncbi:MAG: hypothetical protein QXT53_05545 [Ignisphaera sp.]